MNPFGAPKDYPEMLTKIMVYTFFGSLLLTILVGLGSPAAASLLKKFDFKVGVLGIQNIPIAYVVPPLIIALAARISKLHDRVSDIFRIRERFDLQEILVPLAGGVGIPVDLALREKLEQRRDDVMNDVFYKYASSTKPQIDSHLIIMALDKWSWFWILIELVVVGFLAQVFLLMIGAYKQAAWVATGVLLGTIGATFINRACASSAHAQVRTILSNGAWKIEIKAVFDAL